MNNKEKKRQHLEKYVGFERGRVQVDLPWPDGLRKRRAMPSVAKANEISIRFQAAKVDGTWRDLRRKLDMGEDITLMTFEKFGEIYLSKYVKSYNRAYEDKASRIRILGRKLNPIRMSVLQKSHVTAYVSWRKGQGVKNATINRDLSVFAHMLSWGVGEQYLERNPVPDIQKLKEVKWVGPRPTDEIIDSVFAKLDPRVVPPFTFMRETGCRREEGLSLKHYQIDWGRKEVLFHDNTKNGKDRRVPLSDKAIEAIRAFPKASEYVFYHPESLTRWDTAHKLWEEAREAAGQSWLRTHDLRHAYAIKLAEAGCPMHFISEILGHHSLEYTRRQYAKFSPESASNAVRNYQISANLPLSAA
jgi:integrase